MNENIHVVFLIITINTLRSKYKISKIMETGSDQSLGVNSIPNIFLKKLSYQIILDVIKIDHIFFNFTKIYYLRHSLTEKKG